MAVFCSLGLTSLAVLGHILRVRVVAKADAAATVAQLQTAAAASGTTRAEMSELALWRRDLKRAGSLRRRSNNGVDGVDGSKPATLPLHKLIEAGDTIAVQNFISCNSPALVQELFNMGDPGLNETTPLLLALRLGKDDISTLLLVRSVC